eukprot:TRINITY_DN2580_c0_g1_i1.p1 TRINITY_DN2580_c0_g1~~TRINITY_DN2580_c0_g1_i1.p1  ORF type:complete len:232 (-),score=30.14 TRINITY_DN2580_c0_g1_i1:137-832(-)
MSDGSEDRDEMEIEEPRAGPTSDAASLDEAEEEGFASQSSFLADDIDYSGEATEEKATAGKSHSRAVADSRPASGGSREHSATKQQDRQSWSKKRKPDSSDSSSDSEPVRRRKRKHSKQHHHSKHHKDHRHKKSKRYASRSSDSSSDSLEQTERCPRSKRRKTREVPNYLTSIQALSHSNAYVSSPFSVDSGITHEILRLQREQIQNGFYQSAIAELDWLGARQKQSRQRK